MPDRNPLSTPPKRFRSPIARGLSQSRGGERTVERDGGKFGAGLIRGVAVITRGEALGHDMWIDGVMLSQVADAINATGDRGVKSRFTHPGLSGDGLGTSLGKTLNATVDGDVVRADEHFSQSSHATPDGDLAGYVMGLASESPEDFGTSISFEVDIEATNQFMLDHGGEWKVDPWSGMEYIDGFQSPDPENAESFPHVRLAKLWAVDVVDDPAANPDGLFRKGKIADEAEALVAFSLGLADRPQLSQLDADPDRVRGFVSRFLDRHGLSIERKEPMPKGKNLKAGDPAPETKPAEAAPEEKPVETDAKPAEPANDPPDDPPAEEEPADPPADDPPVDPALSARQECGRYISAFGAKLGAKWFAEGVSFADAQSKYIDHLKEENKRLAAAGDRGEESPVSFGAAGDGKDSPSVDHQRAGLSPALSRFAAANAKRHKG